MMYTTLTDYARAHNLKEAPKLPAGRYHFEPGQEMQFDTSPHRVLFKDGERKCQCASLLAEDDVAGQQRSPRPNEEKGVQRLHGDDDE